MDLQWKISTFALTELLTKKHTTNEKNITVRNTARSISIRHVSMHKPHRNKRSQH